MDLATMISILFAVWVSKIVCSWFMKKSRLQSKSKRLPPGPPRWPIVGNLLQLGRLPHRDFASFCDKYGPLVYLRLGSVDAITTNDPDTIREILLRQDNVFASRPRTLAAVHLSYGCSDVALAPLGPHWKRMRRICMEHLLTTKRLESFSKQRSEEAQHLVQDVWARAETGDAINLREVLGEFSMNNVTRMLLGKQYFGAESAGPEEAMEFMHITHELFRLLGLIYLGDYLPFWRWVDPYGCEKKMRDVEKRVDDFHTTIIEEHRRVGRGKKKEIGVEEDMDFVDVLLSLPGEDGKQHMEDVEIKALIQDMIAAATDTSAVTNEWAMAEVIKHPHVLHKIHQELDSVVGPNRMVSEHDLPHLTYLRCVVRETFRTHPAGPFLIPHEATRDTEINGYHIPAKTRVFINTHGLGRNTAVWDDVDEFRPERHFPVDGSRVEISHGADFKILPFSAGKRKCPGAPLGVVLVLMGLARLFHCFDWTPPPHEDIDTDEVYGMTMPKAKPLMAIARPRLAAHIYHLK
ncbi:cytochrome P450, family 703, subfamily A, polypeptide 2 [Actinidia rufa]|uniref:Cytochrome P450, family 703, subfamily A, polypeptide 2 n=1 Tax=Actinidia rufa TaxID=165716 RepID=A0A7J0EUN4_9ERIC|nr:cytochrome P450, family 703, subfamily A, polypeptide 2 [Actinidia rufa]